MAAQIEKNKPQQKHHSRITKLGGGLLALAVLVFLCLVTQPTDWSLNTAVR